jgi:cytochrome c2
MPEAPKTRHVFNIPKLHWVFFLSSALFAVCVLLMVWVDWSGGELKWLGLRGDREWKNYQMEFKEIEREKLAADIKFAQLQAQKEGLDKLHAELEAAEKQIEERRADAQRVTAQLERLRIEADLINREYLAEKAKRDEVRSIFEGLLEQTQFDYENPRVKAMQARVLAQNEKVDRLELHKQDADIKVRDVERELRGLVEARDALEREISRLKTAEDLAQRRYNLLANRRLINFLNSPLIEFAAPTLKVHQIVAENHRVDVNFAQVPRVDRCVTCHRGIDRPDPKYEISGATVADFKFSTLPQPFRSHPNLDLYVGDTSPHPASKYGCSVCHWGWDRETSFVRAGHTPNDVAQKKLWQKKYRWHEMEFLMQPMRPARHIESSCLKCHMSETHIRGAEKLTHGLRLIEQLGCWSCHRMQQLETYNTHRVALGESLAAIAKLYDVEPADIMKVNNLRSETLAVGQDLQIPIRALQKVGPSLHKIAGKTSPEWTRKWLDDPAHFRANTYMPKFWGLENNADTPERNAAEINAITEYLFTVSEKPKYPPPPVGGNVENGKQLVSTLGCMACHVVDEKLTDLKAKPSLISRVDDWDVRRFRSQGPQLAGTGSKTTENWLYAWLKDPKQYHPKTKMPKLRLTDQEAADIAAYLVSLRHAETDEQKLPEIDPKVLDDLTVEFLEVTMPRRFALEKLNDLDDLLYKIFAEEVLATLPQDEKLAADLQNEYDETFDEAILRRLQAVRARIETAKSSLARIRDELASYSPDKKKNLFLGNKLIGRYGCFACHDIKGFENAKPIGTELSDWGSKPINKLDFGLLHLDRTRFAWLEQKLKEPRSFDRGRVGVTRKPQELLKMPKFNLTEEQIEQIITAITGMTDEKLSAAEPRRLTPEEFHIERGRWLVKEFNCAACHVIEGRGGIYRDLVEAAGMEPPMVSGAPTQLRQGERTQPDWLFHFLKEPHTGEIRPWLKVRMPTFGLTDGEANVLVRYFALEARAQFPYQSPRPAPSPEKLAAGKQLFDKLQCALCHIVEGRALGKPLAEIPPEDLPRLAPDLKLAHKRLQREWLIKKWLPEPLSQVPGTRMPQFTYGEVAPEILDGDERKQLEAIVDYILSLGEEPATPSATAQSP